MTLENTQHRYSITDILGAPCSEGEALRRIREKSDLTTLNVFDSMRAAAQERLLEFIMGKRGLAITYDAVFRQVLIPNGNPERLEHLLSCLLKQKVTIEAILNREGCQISEAASFVIADIIVKLQNGALINVEMQKIGYDFPGERCSCYLADMIMRQYNALKYKNTHFKYPDMRPVHLIIFMEQSPPLFHETTQYIHKKISTFDSGIDLRLLDNLTLISLDTFRSVVQNISTKEDAWLTFFTATDPERICALVNSHPEFLEYYQDLVAFRQQPKELITMFSKALRVMDHNTEVYMVEQLQKKHAELENKNEKLKQEMEELNAKNTEIEAKNAEIAAKNAEMEAKNAEMEAKNAEIEAKNAEIAAKSAAKDAQIKALEEQIASLKNQSIQ